MHFKRKQHSFYFRSNPCRVQSGQKTDLMTSISKMRYECEASKAKSFSNEKFSLKKTKKQT